MTFSVLGLNVPLTHSKMTSNAREQKRKLLSNALTLTPPYNPSTPSASPNSGKHPQAPTPSNASSPESAATCSALPLELTPNQFAAKEARLRGLSNYDDRESNEDVNESILDHAPNWANGVETDSGNMLGLLMRGKENSTEKKREKEEIKDGM